MKTSSPLPFSGLLLACTFLLAGCELPPRETWNIIRRDGLLTYWSREYHPPYPQSRYLGPRHGTPFRPGSYTQRVVPYRPNPDSRYMVSTQSPAVPYRSTPRRVRPERIYNPRVIEEVPAPIVDMEPAVRRTNNPPVIATTPVPPPATESIPYGASVPGRPGMVTSPFAQKQQLVDVTGMAPGEVVKDPYSGKLFRVPPTQQAAVQKTEPVAPATSEAAQEESKPEL